MKMQNYKKYSLYNISQIMIDIFFSIKDNKELSQKEKNIINRNIESIKKTIEKN